MEGATFPLPHPWKYLHHLGDILGYPGIPKYLPHPGIILGWGELGTPPCPSIPGFLIISSIPGSS